MSLARNDEVSGRWVNDEEDHLYGDLVATLAVSGRADLTDAQWEIIEPMLPPSRFEPRVEPMPRPLPIGAPKEQVNGPSLFP